MKSMKRSRELNTFADGIQMHRTLKSA